MYALNISAIIVVIKWKKDKPYRESFRYKIANSKIGRAVMAVSMLPLAPLVDSVARSRADYDGIALQDQRELSLVMANIHNQPLIQKINFFGTNFEQADPQKILSDHEPDITCFQEISEEDALSLRDYGDVVFVSNNEYPLNGKVGIALVSRRRIESVETPNLSLDKDRKRPVILATIDNLRIACLHLTNSTALAEAELAKLVDLQASLDIIMGDLNLTPEQSDPTVGDIGYTSRLDVPTHPKSAKVIDRIILPDESRILVYNFDSNIIEIHSDHRGVVVIIKPSNWANINMKDFKGALDLGTGDGLALAS